MSEIKIFQNSPGKLKKLASLALRKGNLNMFIKIRSIVPVDHRFDTLHKIISVDAAKGYDECLIELESEIGRSLLPDEILILKYQFYPLFKDELNIENEYYQKYKDAVDSTNK